MEPRRGIEVGPVAWDVTLLGNIDKWEQVSQGKLQFHDGRAVEIGHTLYHASAGHEVLRVVVLRARKENDARQVIFERDRYDYVAWVTNIGQHEMPDTKIVEFYRGRGHCAENMIRELKNGFDLNGGAQPFSMPKTHSKQGIWLDCGLCAQCDTIPFLY